jgi:hypothetical protein
LEKEVFEVFNPGSTNISLTVKEVSMIAPVMEIASHHRRRRNRGRRMDVLIPSHQVVDLVEKTGFSVVDLEANEELGTYLSRGTLIRVIPENLGQMQVVEPLAEVLISDKSVEVTEDATKVSTEDGDSVSYDRESLELQEEDFDEPVTDKVTVEDEILEDLESGTDEVVEKVEESEEKTEEPEKEQEKPKKYKPKTVSKKKPGRKKRS